MNRVEKGCCGDCAKCTLLASGEVDMIPCVLDQMFRRVQRLETMMEVKPVKLAGDLKCLTNKTEDDE